MEHYEITYFVIYVYDIFVYYNISVYNIQDASLCDYIILKDNTFRTSSKWYGSLQKVSVTQLTQR